MARAGKVCRTPRCPNPAVAGGCCAEHTLSRQERGYGATHSKARAALLRLHKPGTPCPRCRQPMYAFQGLDAAHSEHLRHDTTSVADHLEHAHCNQGDTRSPT